MTLLQLHNVSIQFHNATEPTVSGLSFALKEGSTTAIVGESGSGKSITALSITKLNPATRIVQGSVMFRGENISTLSEKQLQAIRGNDIGMIFQEPMSALNPLHSIHKQLSEILLLHGSYTDKATREQRILALMDEVELSHLKSRLHDYPHQLSGGERQRVMIAMAIANHPALLIADEPTTALDVSTQAQIITLLQSLQARYNMAILLITHDLHLVRGIADNIIVMQQGRAVEQGKTEYIFARPTHPYTQTLIAATHAEKPEPTCNLAKPLLACEDLAVVYKFKQGFSLRHAALHQALHPLSLTVHEGETLGIVGESGSGKTTLGLALARLLPSKGIITYIGQGIHNLSSKELKPLRASLQFVFQDPFSSLNPRMTIEQIVSEGVCLHFPTLTKAEIQQRVIHILADVGLSEDAVNRYPHEFSGGQRQRINIARAMILRPKLVIFDEPTSALDITLQTQIIALLKKFQAEYKMGFIFISHDIHAVKSISHSIIVLKHGHIIEQGRSSELLSKPSHEYTKSLLKASGLVA